MGEAYKGLTIRIGADTTKLEYALSSVRKSVSNVQSNLTSLNKALKLDPGNLQTMTMKMVALGEKSELTAKELAILQEEEKQLRDTDAFKAKAASAGKFNEYLNTTRDNYNRLNNELAHLKNMLEDVSKQNDIAFDKKHVTDEMLKNISKVSSAASHLVDKYIEVRSTWEAVSKAHDEANMLAGFDKLQAKIAETKAEIVSLAAESSKMKTASDVIKGVETRFTTLNSKLEMSETAMKRLEAEQAKIKTALEGNPDSYGLLAMQARNAADQATVLRQRIEQDREAIEALKSTGLDSVSMSLESAYENAAKTAKEFEKATVALETERGRAAALEKAILDCEAQTKRLAAGQELESENILESSSNASMLYKNMEMLAIKTVAAKDSTKELSSNLAYSKDYVELVRGELAKCKDALAQTEAKAASLRQQFEAGEISYQKFYPNIKKCNKAIEEMKADVASFNAYLETAEERASELGAKLNEAESNEKALTAEASRYKSEIASAESAIRGAAAELEKWETSGKTNTKSIEDLKQEYVECTAKVEKLEEAEKSARKAASQAEGIAQLREYEADIVETTGKLNKMAAAEEKVATEGKVALSGLTSLGTTLSYTLTPAITMAGTFMLQWAKDVDTSFLQMKKTTTEASTSFDELRAAALKYSETHYVDPSTLLDIEALGGQLGLTTDEVERFAEVISNLSISTDLDADTAAEEVGQLNNILDDLTVDTMSNYADALVRLGNNNAAMESSIQDITSRIASMGANIGMTTPELLAWSTAIAATGQGSEAAGTAISKTMAQIESAVGAGGDKLEAFAKVAQMSADEFTTMWNEKPSAAMQKFVEGLHSIEESGGSVSNTLQGLGITGIRQMQTLQSLSRETGTLNTALMMSYDAWNGVSDAWGNAGDAANEADTMTQGFAGTWQKLVDTAMDFADKVGTSLIDPLKVLTTIVGDVANAFDGLPKEFQQFAVMGALATAAVGPLLRAFSSIVTNGPKFSQSLKSASSGLETLSSKAKTTASTIKLEAAGIDVSKLSTEELTVALKAAANGEVTMSNKTALVTAKLTALGIAENAAAVAARVLETATKLLNVAFAAISVISIVAVIAELASACSETSDAESELEESHKSLMDEISKSESDSQSSSDTIYELADKFKQLSDETSDASLSEEELSEKQGELCTVGKALAGQSDALANAFDAESGSAKASVDSIVALAKAEADKSRNESRVESYNKLLEEEADLEDRLYSAQNNLNAATEAYNDAISDISENYGAYTDNTGEVNKYAEEVESLTKKLAENRAEQTDLYNSMAKYQTRTNNLSNAYKKFGTDAASAAKYLETLATTEDDVISQEEYEAYVAQQAAIKELEHAEAVAEVSDEMESLIETYPLISEAINNAGISIDQFSTLLTDAGYTADDFSSIVSTATDNVRDGFTRMELDTDKSLQTFIDNFYNNVQLQSQYMDDLKTIYEKGYADIDSAFFKKALNEGPSTWGTMIHQMAETTDSSMADFVSDWSNYGDQTASGYASMFIETLKAEGVEISDAQAEALEDMPDVAEEAADEAGDSYGTTFTESSGNGITETVDNITSAVKYVTGEATDVAGDAGVDAYWKGTDYANGYANGISDTNGVVYTAAYNMAQQANQAVKDATLTASPSRVAKELGAYFGEGYGLGIESQYKYVAEISARMANNAISALDKYDTSSLADKASSFARNVADMTYSSNFSQSVNVQGQLTKADIYDVVSAVMQANDDDTEVAIYMDSKKVASSIAKPMDRELGKLAGRSRL